jgi:hypothetical protein
MRRCSSPLSPIALRAALIRVKSVDSENDAPAPHGGEQIVFADDALAIADQVLEDVEDLTLKGDQRVPVPQLAPRRIQREIFKGVDQCTTPLAGAESTPTCALTSLTSRTVPVNVITFRRMTPYSKSHLFFDKLLFL